MGERVGPVYAEDAELMTAVLAQESVTDAEPSMEEESILPGEVYVVVERAEQATTKLLQATTEEECHEARMAMSEEIMTLLELLGSDNPRAEMAIILQAYAIGDLRELLQRLIASNRMKKHRTPNWMQVLYTHIAKRAILVHDYESSQRQVDYALAR